MGSPPGFALVSILTLALGTGTLVRVASSFGVRQLVKLIPVYGQTAGAAAAAAASFAATYAMGKAAVYFMAMRKKGETSGDLAANSSQTDNSKSPAFDLGSEQR